MRARLQGSGTLTIICPVYTFFIADPEPASILSQYTSVLANSYAEKSPAVAAAALLRRQGWISTGSSPNQEQSRLPTTILWYLQYSTLYSTK